MFVRNAWYCAGWSHGLSLGSDGLLARRIAGESLLLYRTASGRAVAMLDRCAHRSAPLSLGRKEGDAVRCMYHGLLFASDGSCVEAPGMKKAPESARIRTFPVAERDGWIWIWMGDVDRADENLICYAIGPDDPDWRLKTNQIRIETNYRQEIANLADLSHVSWVHGMTFGGTADWSLIKPNHALTARGIETKYCVRGVPAPTFAKHLFPTQARFDIQVHVRLTVPCNFILSFAVHEAGDATQGPTNGKLVLDTFSSQAVTPRDEGSVDYYFSWGTSKATYFPGIVDLMFEANEKAFFEDKRILEGQRQRKLEYPNAVEVDILHDAGPGRMLWVLDKLLKEEVSTTPAGRFDTTASVSPKPAEKDLHVGDGHPA